MKTKTKKTTTNPTIAIVEKLYLEKTSNWIFDTDVALIEPYVIQLFLVMDDRIRVQTRWLDKYVYALPPRMYLSLAWSVLPKEGRGFVPYIKEKSEEETFWFILEQIRKHFQLADNDYNTVKSRLIEAIKKDMVSWFSFYGIKKRYWEEFYLNFNLIKEYGDKPKPTPQGLEVWGL